MLAYGLGALLLLRVYGNGIYTCSADYNYTFVCADYINQRVFFKTKLSVSIIAGLVVCVIGVGLVIGADFKSLFSGRALGYLLAFGAVISWNLYNFITARISRTYTELTMAFNQLLCTVLISLPYATAVMPPAECFTPKIILSLAYLGVGSAGTGYLIYVRGVKYLGPTISSLFSNFLPVTSTFFGWLILGQSLGSYADCRRADSYCIRLLCYYRKKQTAKTGTEAQTGK